MYHGSNTLVNWPSLFKEFARPMPHNISVSCVSARSLVSALRIAYTIDRSTLLANPFFDVPISVAARAFLAQRTVMIPDQTTIDNSWIESNLGTCMDVLANMAQYWGGADIVGELLEQRGAKFHRRTPSARNAVNSPNLSRPSLLVKRGSQAGHEHDFRLSLSTIQSGTNSTGSFLQNDAAPASAPLLMDLPRSFGSKDPLSTPRQERIPPLLAGPATVASMGSLGSQTSSETGPDGEDVFASFFHQNISSGSGTIDNMGGSHISTAFSNQLSTDLSSHQPPLSDSSGFSSLLGSGMDHVLYPVSGPATQW